MESLNDIVNNIMPYFQNFGVGKRGQGIAKSEYAQEPKVLNPVLWSSMSPSSQQQAPKPRLDVKFATSDKPTFPQEYIPYVEEAASKYKIDPLILASLAAQETGGYGYDPSVVGSSGERGVTQIIPSIWAKTADYANDESGWDMYGNALANDPRMGFLEAARILSMLEEQYPEFGLAVYNGGPNFGDQALNYQNEVLRRIGR